MRFQFTRREFLAVSGTVAGVATDERTRPILLKYFPALSEPPLSEKTTREDLASGDGRAWLRISAADYEGLVKQLAEIPAR